MKAIVIIFAILFVVWAICKASSKRGKAIDETLRKEYQHRNDTKGEKK